MSKTITTTTIR